MICSLRWSDTPRAIRCPSCGEEDAATSGAACCILKIEAHSQPRFAQIAAFDRILRLRKRRALRGSYHGNPARSGCACSKFQIGEK
jgi:hypothetical protein